MLRSNEQIRFTASEIDQARRLGIDLAGVNTMADYSDAVIRLITTLESGSPKLDRYVPWDSIEATEAAGAART